MLKNTRHRPIFGSLPGILRSSLPGLLVFALATIPLPPITPDAFAITGAPTPGLETMKSGYPLGKPDEVSDFEPHYGIMPITIGAPVPTYGRGYWCYGPIYVCYIVGCTCIPLPYNWCEEPYECAMTNVVNLEATLLIKHAWPKGGARLADASNLTVLKPDNLYRDLCVNGADLKYDQFDSKTGQVIVAKVKDPITGKDTYTPANSQLYDSTSTGTVSGVKQVLGSCMPRINTRAFEDRDPKYAVPTNDNAAFSYYVNADNDPFSGIGEDKKDPVTVYGTSNRYLKTTFFLSGQFGCPSDISGIPLSGKVDGGTPEKTALIWKEAAAKCYDYFIFERATHPEWTLERPGPRTDDPLTFDKARGGDPDMAIFDNCQPMLSGPDSRAVLSGLSPVDRGYAPVLKYQRPDLDEADYSPQRQLQKGFAARFPGRPVPGFQDIFPCIKNMADVGGLQQTDWSKFNNILIANYAISAFVEASVLHLTWGLQYFKPMKNQPYSSPGKFKSGFCPNVEKINLPTNPFAPRDDYKSLAHPKGISFPNEPGINKIQHYADLYKNAILTGNNPFSGDDLRDNMFTDRDYSYQTSYFTPGDRITHLSTWTTGYSDYNNPSTLASVSGMIRREKYPEVMCAVVPVDILEPRRQAFDSCIMERINFNFITWRRRNFLSYYYSTQTGSGGGANLEVPVAPIMGDIFSGVLEDAIDVFPVAFSAMAGRDGTLKPWVKPCKTRFYESDTFDECPVAMSIQQCCRIIVKDVVPMNYIKIRTCEGLRDKRDIIFGYDHLYDYSEKVTDTFKDDWAIANAKTQAEKDAANQIVLVKNLDTPFPISSQGGKSVKTPASEAEYDSVYDMNQKLTMIGCDGTEPDSYAFSYYNPLSEWSDPKVTGSPSFLMGKATIPITMGITGAQNNADDLIDEARRLAATSIATNAISTAWTDYMNGINTVETSASTLKADADKLAVEAQVSISEAGKLVNEEKALLPGVGKPEYLLLQGLGSIPLDTHQKIIDAAPAAAIAAGTAAVKAKGAAYALETLLQGKQAGLDILENSTKTLAADWLTLRQNYVINNGATIANKAIDTAIGTVKSQGPGLSSKLTTQFNNLISKAPPAKLAMMVAYGEGGAHMPYMRRWDTGTSAGNPLHGGSFINTLGSYDVIIGVGHEERSYGDASNTTTDVQTVQDAGAIAAALAKLETARKKYSGLRTDLYNRVTGIVNFMNSYGHGLIVPTGEKIYWGTGANADKVYFNYNSPGTGNVITVDAANVCNLWRGGGALANGYGHDSDCYPVYRDIVKSIENKLPAAKQAVADAEVEFENARHQSITTYTTTTDAAKIPEGEAKIKAAHMGRIGGWDGLKGHQMLSIYRNNLSCIGRYEKLFKGLGQENFVLSRAGTTYYTPVDHKPIPWPLAWRGFINDPNNEFEKHKIADGFDNAQSGDIAIFTISGMKKLGYVTYVNNASEPKFVKIESWDQGKFPTAAGASLTLGTSVDRTIYKTNVPPNKKIDNLAVDKAAKVNGQPSCEDPSYTSCVLGGSLNIIGEGGAVAKNIPNSTWDTVEIYRPSADTDTRKCPMVSSEKDPKTGKLKIDLSKVPADSASFCINAGFDPPYIDIHEGSKAAEAGNISDSTLCGPQWGTCKVATQDTVQKTKDLIRCFPGGDVCAHPDTVPLPPPATTGDTSCTADEYNTAKAAYDADVKKLGDDKADEDVKVKDANKAVQDAADALNDYKNSSSITIAGQKVTDATGTSNQAISVLNNQLITAQQNLTNAEAMTIPAPVLDVDGVTVLNQAAIDTATTQKQQAIDNANTAIDNINAEINKQNTVLCVSGELKAAVDDLQAKQSAAVAARNDLNDYLQNNVVTDTTSDADKQTIENNYATLRDKFDKATQAATEAQAKVDQLEKLLDCISPPTQTTKQMRDAANTQINTLQDELNKKQADAEALEQDLNKLKDMKVPQMSCPYIPLAQQ